MVDLPLIRGLFTRFLVRLSLLLLVLLTVFVAVDHLPGDAARSSLERGASAQDVAAAQRRMGLDRPVVDRFWSWLLRIAHGDLGVSAQGGSVRGLLVDRLPVTLITAGTALALTTIGSVLIGAWWMRHPTTRRARSWETVSGVLVAVPEFVTGTGLVIVFALVLNMLPAVTIAGFDGRPASGDMYVLPVAALFLPQLGWNSRIARAALLDAASAPHVRAARLAGVSEKGVLWRHIFPLAAPTITTSLVTTCGMTIAGSVAVETLFHHPGVGALVAESVQSRDVPVLAAVLALTGVLLLALLTLADLVRGAMKVAS